MTISEYLEASSAKNELFAKTDAPIKASVLCGADDDSGDRIEIDRFDPYNNPPYRDVCADGVLNAQAKERYVKAGWC
jgi:hypothetical protein